MDNQATTPLSCCPSTVFLPVRPHCVNARLNRCQDLNSFPWRTGGDHQDAEYYVDEDYLAGPEIQ